MPTSSPVSPPQHAKYSPSSLARTMTCPGSIRAAKDVPVEPSSPFAERGTHLHEVTEHYVNAGEPPKAYAALNPDEQAWVSTCVEYVESLSPHKLTETRVDVIPNRDCWGTVDLVAMMPQVLEIVDYKFGYTPVEVQDNPQLMAYALGAAKALDWWAPYHRYKITIIQPQLTPSIRTEEVSGDDLLHFESDLSSALDYAEQPDAPRIPSETACRWCPAKAVCPELASVMVDALEGEPARYDANLLASRLSRVKLAEAWVKAIKGAAHTTLTQGIPIHGWKLVLSRTHRKWIDEGEALTALLKYLKEDQLFTRQMTSPAKAEKLLGKTHRQLVKALTESPEGVPSLAPVSDSRPGIPSALDDFTDLTQGD